MGGIYSDFSIYREYKKLDHEMYEIQVCTKVSICINQQLFNYALDNVSFLYICINIIHVSVSFSFSSDDLYITRQILISSWQSHRPAAIF